MNKKITTIISGLACIYGSTLEAAQSLNNINYDYTSKHQFTIAPETYYYEYEEPGVMNLDGNFYGINFNYTYSIIPDTEDANYLFSEDLSRFFISLETHYAQGQTDYESDGTGTMDDQDNYVFEIRALYGFDYEFGESSYVSPYIGLGYRYLNHDLRGTSSTGAIGYERESNYLYMPIGSKLTTSISETTDLGCSLEFDLFIEGTQKSHLEDVSSSLSVMENDQNSGYGLRASLFMTKQFETSKLTIEPFIRYWDIDDSEIAFIYNDGTYDWYGWEPENNTLEVGLQVGLTF